MNSEKWGEEGEGKVSEEEGDDEWREWWMRWVKKYSIEESK